MAAQRVRTSINSPGAEEFFLADGPGGPFHLPDDLPVRVITTAEFAANGSTR